VKNNIVYTRKGQMLITLLIFILVAFTIAATSVSIIISNAQNTQNTGQSMEAYYAAETGIENASLQLLRNPDYTGETVYINERVSTVIDATHGAQYVVTATGRSGIFTRKIQAILDYTDNVLSVISWQELL
jgi:type II secretory pathway component PulK